MRAVARPASGGRQIFLDARVCSPYTFHIRIPGGHVSDAPKKKPVCCMCGRPSPKTICAACAGIVQGDALHNKKKEDKK